MPKALPWVKWDYMGWITDERVNALTPVAYMVYHKLLSWQVKDGSVANDARGCARRIGEAPNLVESVWSEVRPFFDDLGDGRMENARMRATRDEMLARVEAESKRGSRGGRASVEARIKAKSTQVQPQVQPQVNNGSSESQPQVNNGSSDRDRDRDGDGESSLRSDISGSSLRSEPAPTEKSKTQVEPQSPHKNWAPPSEIPATLPLHLPKTREALLPVAKWFMMAYGNVHDEEKQRADVGEWMVTLKRLSDKGANTRQAATVFAELVEMLQKPVWKARLSGVIADFRSPKPGAPAPYVARETTKPLGDRPNSPRRGITYDVEVK